MESKNFHDLYVVKNNKKLKYGYSTGSCAAAAAKAAAYMLLSGVAVEYSEIMTPKGIKLKLPIEEVLCGEGFVSCAVRKYSGDDPDVTNGVLVYAKVKKTDTGQILIDGGTGVGRITRAGLEQEVGAAAINKVPRRMIKDCVGEVLEKYHYSGGMEVVISIPDGVKLAAKTFNPRLGIEGGISVLGTSGIVEPMSEKAIIDSIRVELKMLKANGAENIVITPGNYGSDFSKETLSVPDGVMVKCSNFIGETIDLAVEMEFKGVLFIGHIGKFVKVAGGIMNTHSKNADARMEIMAAHAVLAGGDLELVKSILSCINTDDAISYMNQKKITEPVMASLMDRVKFYIDNRACQYLETAVILFSNKHGILGRTDNTDKLLNKIKETRL